MRIIWPSAILAALLTAQTPTAWTAQTSGVDTRLRGVSAVSEKVVWASGARGTVLRTADGGATWHRLTVPDAADLDFRDIDAIDERNAYVLSIGNGAASRIYKTSDAGSTWTLQFRNDDPDAFFDAIAFRDARHGFAFSDSVKGRFVILRTDDEGAHWMPVAASSLPPALEGEGAFAASGSNIAVRGDRVWIGTTAARVVRSEDGGRSWNVVQTPLATGPSAGIFSVAFKDGQNGIVVGGDYKKESEAVDNAAITSDGGRTWNSVAGLSGFRSAVAYVPGTAQSLVAVGPSGTDVSTDGGKRWTSVSGPGFHAMAFAPQSAIAWGVGEKGTIGRFTPGSARSR
jgi:photosystem II stability/assembly factor-like uncharacterized protein